MAASPAHAGEAVFFAFAAPQLTLDDFSGGSRTGKKLLIKETAPGGSGRMQTQTDYYKLREQAERAAAKTAVSEQARRVHQELAQHYADLVRRG